MLRIIQEVAEELIQRAMREGAFENLPGKGRPLPDEDDSHIPADLRMPYKILKNAGCLPPELESRKDIQTAIELLSTMTDEKERYRQIRKLNYMITRLNVGRRRPIALEEEQLYYEKIVERVRLEGKREKDGNAESEQPG
jgi:hypothetical protein